MSRELADAAGSDYEKRSPRTEIHTTCGSAMTDATKSATADTTQIRRVSSIVRRKTR